MARHVVTLGDLLHLRLGRRAQLLGPGAAGAEAAPRRRIERRGELPAQVRECAGVHRRVRQRDGRDKGVGVRVGGPVEQRVGRPDLAHLAQVHDRDAVRHVLDDRQVVGDEDEGQAVAGLHVLEQVEDLGLHRHVERGDGLVADDQLRVGDDRAGDRDALALAAGELVGLALGRGGRIDADRGQDLLDLGGPGGGVTGLPDRQRLPDDLAHRAAGVQRADRILDDHLHAGPDLAQLSTLEGGELRSVEAHRPAGGAGELHDGLAGGRLAAAGLADQAEGLALGDVEGHVGDRGDLAAAAGGEVDDQVLDPQEDVLVHAEVRRSAAGHQRVPCDGPGNGGGVAGAGPLNGGGVLETAGSTAGAPGGGVAAIIFWAARRSLISNVSGELTG